MKTDLSRFLFLTFLSPYLPIQANSGKLTRVSINNSSLEAIVYLIAKKAGRITGKSAGQFSITDSKFNQNGKYRLSAAINVKINFYE